MNKTNNGKFTISYVRQKIENEWSHWMKLKLLDDTYENNAAPLQTIDENGYKYNQSFARIQANYQKGFELSMIKGNPFALQNMQQWLINNNRKDRIITAEFVSTRQKLDVVCENGHVYKMDWSHLQRGQGCVCLRNKRILTFDIVNLDFEKRGYALLATEYKNNQTLMPYICNKHKERGVQYIHYGNLHNGYGCKYCGYEQCSIKNTKNEKQFIDDFYKVVDDKLTLMGGYKNGNTKILVKCNLCNKTFERLPKILLRGDIGCLYCTSSSGEERIDKILNCKNISFIRQYVIPNCRNIKPLPFDFAILDKQENIVCLIEYDGVHHYKPTSFGSKNEQKIIASFEKQKLNDEIKNKYCNDNNINLIRIPYTEFKNLEKIIEQYLIDFELAA